VANQRAWLGAEDGEGALFGFPTFGRHRRGGAPFDYQAPRQGGGIGTAREAGRIDLNEDRAGSLGALRRPRAEFVTGRGVAIQQVCIGAPVAALRRTSAHHVHRYTKMDSGHLIGPLV